MGVIVWEVLCGGSKVPYDGVADDKVICRLGGGGGLVEQDAKVFPSFRDLDVFGVSTMSRLCESF